MRRGIAIAAAVLLFSAASPAQFIITEIFTGTTDFVEVTNVSAAAAPIAGIGLLVGVNSVCLASIGGGGPYVATSAALIPPGGTFIFEDGGTAGSTVLSAGLLGAGERIGFNNAASAATVVEATLYSGGVPGAAPNFWDETGILLDYVQVQIAITGTPAQPTLDQFRNHPGTIATPTGHWQSGPFFRGNPLDSIFRVHSAGVYLDTNSNADWSASAAHTGGALNPVAAPGVATQGVELNVIHPSGEAVPVLSFNVATYNPPAAGATYYTLISFTPSTCAGFSPAPFIPAPIFGMPIDVWGQLFAATPLPPLNGTLDAAGTALGIVTPPIPPPFAGLPIQMRTFVLIGGLPTLFSDHVFRTI